MNLAEGDFQIEFKMTSKFNCLQDRTACNVMSAKWSPTRQQLMTSLPGGESKDDAADKQYVRGWNN